MRWPSARPEPVSWPAPTPGLRVVQVCPGGPGSGTEARGSRPEVDFGLCRALDAAGVRQQIVTAGPPRSPRRRRWGLRGEIHRVAPPGGARHLFGPAAAPLLAELAARADLVHVHPGAGLSALAAALWAARRHGLATLVDAPPGRVDGPLHLLERRLLPQAGAVLCPDDGTRRRLADLGLAEDLLVELPRNGLPAGAGDGRSSRAASTAPEIRWGPVAGDLLGIYRRVRRPRSSGTRRGFAGRTLAEAAGEGR